MENHLTDVNSGGFWDFLEKLVSESKIIIDRPKGSRHPKYADIIYPFDYGYLEGTKSGDGGEVDIWVGTLKVKNLSAILLTIDLKKRDAEIKSLIGCSEDEIQSIQLFYNKSNFMRTLLVRNLKE